MELFLLYLWLKLDAVISLFNGVFFVSAGALGIWAFLLGVSEGEVNLVKVRNLASVALVISAITMVVIPTSKQTAYLVGGYYALRVADTPEAQKIVQVLRKKANDYLDAELAGAKK